MPREFSRTRRIGEQIRRDLAALIRSEIGDPRVLMVSITGVEVSRDLAHAKVFVTFLGDAQARTDVMRLLAEHAAHLRQLLGREMRIRTVPRIVFTYDESIERGARLSSLIDAAVAADAARHRSDDETD
ncbi:ribosome-binding factor A [Plasticicumulans lactativorans]|uniref:Ribosome-binding factor A n=1 Tax=Plasticicumulans lactativorans TaxID=1133106 RepID=A0A4R2LD01_9GAMM|nr:30S ribosome-binding factor RbfA [Plasticicumulans lactativorans]TCO82306.1 ribosome-binding factor A [Plasticicumulans lactativorans]